MSVLIMLSCGIPCSAAEEGSYGMAIEWMSSISIVRPASWEAQKWSPTPNILGSTMSVIHRVNAAAFYLPVMEKGGVRQLSAL